MKQSQVALVGLGLGCLLPGIASASPHGKAADEHKITDPGQEDGGALQVYGFSKDIGDDDKTNRVTVGNYGGETNEAWHVTKLSGGKYRLENVLGTREPGEQSWDKPRSLTVTDGKLRNLPSSDDKAPAWTLTQTKKN